MTCAHSVVQTTQGRVTCTACQKDLSIADCPSRSWLFVDAAADLERRLRCEERERDLDAEFNAEELRRFNRYADLVTYADLVR